MSKYLSIPTKSTDSMQSQSKSQHLVNTDKLAVEFILKFKSSRTTNTIFQGNKVRRLIIPDLKTYKPTVIKTVWYWPKNQLIDQQKKNGETDMDPYKCNYLVSNKLPKAIQWSTDGLFNKWC